MEYLQNYEWIDIIPFYNIVYPYHNKYPLNNGWNSTITEEKCNNIKNILLKLNDDKSRAYYLQFIAWHVLNEEWIFKPAPIMTTEKYFIPEIVSILNTHETFLDIGAHHGEFTTKFINVVNDKFNKIYMVEPDHDNIDILLNNLGNNMMDYTISLFPFALKNEITKNKSKFYYKLDSISQLSNLGNGFTRVKKLDDLNIDPTLIKIHVEGTEIDIINSGIKTIKKNRPILLVTVYHNENGLFKNITEIMNLLDDYILYFRLHMWCGTSGIIYAIPKEKLT
jgi:FkbM family methyltransferase